MFSHDEYEALHDRAALLDLTARGRLELTGSDRRAYLQGLLTNDIVALGGGAGCYAALLTPQGRMISDMRVSELGERILIDLPESTSGTVRQRLADFVFSEDVEVRDVSASESQLGLFGTKAAETLAAVLTRPLIEDGKADRRERLEAMPMMGNAAWELAGTPVVVVRSEDYGVRGFELFVHAASAAGLSSALLAAGAEPVSIAAAEATRIEAGWPRFGADMDEHTIPLEAGIEDRAISLTKGCYVGQEVIIRVLHRGQGRVARRLVGFVGTMAAGELERGARLRRDDREIGVITSGLLSPRLKRPIGLGYVHRDYAEPGTVLEAAGAEGESPRRVTVVTTPFTSSAPASE
jgi:folate-binding protein YgfZ